MTKVTKVSDDPTPVTISTDGEILKEVNTSVLSSTHTHSVTTKLNNPDANLDARVANCDTWKRVVDVEEAHVQKIETFEMWCYRRAMRISYVEYVSKQAERHLTVETT